MKWIKLRHKFEADKEVSEKFNLSIEDILEDINAEVFDIWEELSIEPLQIDDLKDNNEILDWLEENEWTLTETTDSRDWETFLKSPVKWAWVLPISGGVPQYIFMQLWDDTGDIWDNKCTCYKVENGYEWEDAITTITIDIVDENHETVSRWTTGNGGNNWTKVGKEEVIKDWDQILNILHQNDYKVKIHKEVEEND